MLGSGHRKVILAADDEKRCQYEIEKALRHALEKGSYELIVFNNCDPVVPKVREGRVDLAILDVLMAGSPNTPWEEGAALARYIKAKHPKVKVVIFSGAWDGVEGRPVDRASVQKQTQADAVVFKECLDPQLDDLGRQVKRLLGL